MRRWQLKDICWEKFDASLVDRELLAVIKTAALVEYNADHYVDYLLSVFDRYPEIQSVMRSWGMEEEQHGEALSKWASLADPDFDFESASQLFNQLYQANEGANESVRGSLGAEMISRCVVESATSFFYTGIRDQCKEPVLKQIAGHIARDEFAHYQLFFDTLHTLDERPGLAGLLKTALARVGEVGDDELASAYYAANANQHSGKAYDCQVYSAAYTAKALKLYTRDHATRMSSMIARAVGIQPYGKVMRTLHPLIWRLWQRNLRKQERICSLAGIA